MISTKNIGNKEETFTIDKVFEGYTKLNAEDRLKLMEKIIRWVSDRVEDKYGVHKDTK